MKDTESILSIAAMALIADTAAAAERAARNERRIMLMLGLIFVKQE